ncbi:MAG: SpoIID/LytB domain-containing protein [Candidatus Krumholzibacteriales bacterium]
MIKFAKKVIPLLALPLVLLYQSCAKETVVYRRVPPSLERSATELRVLVIENVPGIEIFSEYMVAAGISSGYDHPEGFTGSGTLHASCGSGLVKLARGGKTVLETERIILKPERSGFIKLNGTGYRGKLVLTTEGGGGLSAVNYIEVDDYLKGVLPAEIGYLKGKNAEAYRAQALASRSYAISKLEETRGRYYDLKATIMDQVYKGVAGEYPPANRAVEDTRGLVIVWKGNPARAYYSSCCGGHTADIRTNWPWKEHYPFLRGVRDSDQEGRESFCRRSRHFRWRVRWSGDDLIDILRVTLPGICGEEVKPFRKLIDIESGGHSRDGRIKSLTFKTDSGSYRVEGDRIRWVLRPDSPSGAILKSTLLKISVNREAGSVSELKVLGGGNGHGVGMCQSGAIQMSREGYTAGEIISHFYPGVSIEKCY